MVYHIGSAVSTFQIHRGMCEFLYKLSMHKYNIAYTCVYMYMFMYMSLYVYIYIYFMYIYIYQGSSQVTWLPSHQVPHLALF